MEHACTCFPLQVSIICSIIFLSKLFSKSKNLPPRPKRWPIIGSIHKLGDRPHRVVTELSKIYGPIMTLKLGNKTIIVISSPKIVKEMFLEHDLALSSRPVPDALRAENHGNLSMVWLPVSPKWKNLRKIVNIQLFLSQRLDATQMLRQKKEHELVDYVQQCNENSIPVDIGRAAFITTLNLMSNTIFSIDLASYYDSSKEFKDLVWSVMQETVRPNVSDYFPYLKKVDLQGVVKRCTQILKKVIQIYEDIIDERLKSSMDDVNDDILNTLLKLAKDGELSLIEVKHLILDLFVAGTDSTSNTLEWAMTELIRNPEIIKKAQIEMDKVVRKDESIQETHIKELPYIQAIVKESMRIRSPGPFLLPHKDTKDVKLHGYLVPKESTIWVNVWSMGHDPDLWSEPEVFSPERFIERKIDVKGQDFEFIPFGSRRRICPGMPLANRMVHLMLANLVHSFNWKSLKAIEEDMEEKFGITIQKVEPLQAIQIFRCICKGDNK